MKVSMPITCQNLLNPHSNKKIIPYVATLHLFRFSLYVWWVFWAISSVWCYYQSLLTFTIVFLILRAETTRSQPGRNWHGWTGIWMCCKSCSCSSAVNISTPRWTDRRQKGVTDGARGEEKKVMCSTNTARKKNWLEGKKGTQVISFIAGG